MWYIILTVVFLLIIALTSKLAKPLKRDRGNEPAEDQKLNDIKPAEDQKHDYTNSYIPKWLFSYNEKDAFQKIKQVTDQHGLTLLSKVRLFDLVEPKKGSENYKGAMWKVQAKHVDFVICDAKLVARYIIELDDGSHAAEARQERDNFVDTVLQNCGYKVMHTKNIVPAELEAWLTNKVAACGS